MVHDRKLPRAHYVTLDGCQIRLWRAGQGPQLVVLPGLILGAGVVAARLSACLPAWTVSVLELPGLGGSASAGSATLDAVADHLATGRLWSLRLTGLDAGSPTDRGEAPEHLSRLGTCREGSVRLRPADGWPLRRPARAIRRRSA
jgi:hypothetical protein